MWQVSDPSPRERLSQYALAPFQFLQACTYSLVTSSPPMSQGCSLPRRWMESADTLHPSGEGPEYFPRHHHLSQLKY